MDFRTPGQREGQSRRSAERTDGEPAPWCHCRSRDGHRDRKGAGCRYPLQPSIREDSENNSPPGTGGGRGAPGWSGQNRLPRTGFPGSARRGGQELEGDCLVQDKVEGFVDLAHTAFTQHAENAVSPARTVVLRQLDWRSPKKSLLQLLGKSSPRIST